MMKTIIFDTEARETIQSGLRRLAGAVKVMFGPRGHLVALERPGRSPLLTKDGATVARDIDLPEGLQNVGAQLIKEVAMQTEEVAGDGSTTATIYAEAIFDAGLRSVTGGANPYAIRSGIEHAVCALTQELKSMSEPIEANADDLRGVVGLTRDLSGSYGPILLVCMLLPVPLCLIALLATPPVIPSQIDGDPFMASLADDAAT